MIIAGHDFILAIEYLKVCSFFLLHVIFCLSLWTTLYPFRYREWWMNRNTPLKKAQGTLHFGTGKQAALGLGKATFQLGLAPLRFQFPHSPSHGLSPIAHTQGSLWSWWKKKEAGFSLKPQAWLMQPIWQLEAGTEVKQFIPWPQPIWCPGPRHLHL